MISLQKAINDHTRAPKTYWSILKVFMNGTTFLVDSQIATDFLEKANLFDNNFSQQCTTIISNSSTSKNPTF